MVKRTKMKKLTLRLLAVFMMVMTAVAFMPAAADAVWADEPETPTTNTYTPIAEAGATLTDRPDKINEFVLDISYGPIRFYGSYVTYYTKDGVQTVKDIPSGWYNLGNEFVIIGKTPNAGISEGMYGPHDIMISGGHHRITLREVTMSPPDGFNSFGAIQLDTNARVTFTLSGTNTITSRDLPGIYAPSGSTLTIKGEDIDPDGNPSETLANSHSLTASALGSSSNAGIGGSGKPGNSGTITIESGTITATGCLGGAGIGGSTSGSGNITINGGKINAYGGSDDAALTGSPGIGCGSTGTGGSVTLSSKASIKAYGGTGLSSGNQTIASGITAGVVNSGNGTILLTSTNGVSITNTTTASNFNGIVWTNEDEDRATVYGDVVLSNVGDMEHGTYPALNLDSKDVLNIPAGSSVTTKPNFNCNNATVTGSGEVTGDFSNYTSTTATRLHFLVSLDQYKDTSIHIVGAPDEHGETNYTEYTGEPVRLLRDLITIDEKADGYYLDTDNWNIEASRVFSDGRQPEFVDSDKIIDAGDYELLFTHKMNARPSFTITGAKIVPKPLDEDMVDMEDTYSYGEAINITLYDGDRKANLIPGESSSDTEADYILSFKMITDKGVVDIDAEDVGAVGEYIAVFTGINNYTTEKETGGVLEMEFEIEPTSIKGAAISGFKNTYTYDGAPQLDSGDIRKLEVSLDGVKIDSSEYDIEFSNSSLPGSASSHDEKEILTVAGTVTITIIAKDINYTDEASTTFEINQKAIRIKEAKASYTHEDGTEVSSRPYDGTKVVRISNVELNTKDIITGDTVYVSLEGLTEDSTDDLTGTVSNAKVGDYEEVTLKNVRLAGEDAFNYKVTDATVDLGPKAGGFDVFTITKLVVPKPVLSVTSKLSDGDPDKFQCTVEIDNKPNDGAEYVYAVSEKSGDSASAKWQTSNTFDGLLSNTEYWFYAKVKDPYDNMVPENMDDLIGYTKYKTPLLPQNPPEDFKLEITLDDNGETYTVTIPTQENAQYSFDGTNFSKSNVLKKVGPNETVTGYIKFPATKTHAESPVTTYSDITPPLTVKTPVITPEDGAFYGSAEVSIKCGTKGATIYYTTDGNYPTPSDEKYTRPFVITEDTTVMAVAVKNEMEDSEAASVDFVYTEYDPIAKSEVQNGVQVTNELKTNRDLGLYTIDKITAALSTAITKDGGGYTYQNIAYYDLKVKVSFDNGKSFETATAENFPDDGAEVTVKYPKNTSGSTHDFRVAHMFSQSSDRLGTTAGDIEMPEPTEGADGLTFTVSGASPLAIGWVESAEEGGGDEGEGGDSGNDPSPQNDDGNTNPTNADGTPAGGANANGANGTGGANGDGTGADGDGSGSGTGGVVDELVNAVSTGDFTNPLLWAALAILSFLIMIVIIVKKRR